MQIPFIDVNQKWYVVNSLSKEQLGPFSTYHFQDYLNRLDPSHLLTTLVRSPNLLTWYKASEVLRILNVLQIPYDPLPPPLRRASHRLQVQVANTPDALFTGPIYVVKRKFPRISGALNVSILSEKQYVRTQTRTLSMGGLGFISALPRELFSPNSKAVLSAEGVGHSIVVTLSDITTKQSSNSLTCASFHELRGAAMTTYFDWMKSLGG